MKLVIIILLFLSFSCVSQEQAFVKVNQLNFEEFVLELDPIKKSSLSDSRFNRGTSILKRTQKAIREDFNKFTVTDYWNITLAFALLDLPKEYINLSFEKGIEKNRNSICEYLNISLKDSKNNFNLLKEALGDKYVEFLNSCDPIPAENEFDISKYVLQNNIDLNLVKLIDEIKIDDQKFRSPYIHDKQKALDDQNLKLIDSLFDVHKQYVGKSLVGDKYDFVMWMVIQHSNIESMKKYLPIIQNAVKKGELHSTPFKMLIDRVYTIENGYQIFGSQGGVEIITDAEERERIIKFYNLQEN